MNERIAIDGTAALAQGGGIGRFTRGLLQGLAECDQETPFVIGYAKDVAQPPFRLPPNFRWRRLPLSQKQATWLWHRLRAPLPADWLLGRPALFHSPDYTLPPLGSGTRAIVTVHDLSYEALADVHEPPLRRFLQRAVPHAIQRADHLFADSESTRQEIVRYYGTDPAKISVVYPGVEPRFRPLDPNAPEDALQLDEVRRRFALDRRFVLSVGTLEPRKNIATLIRAFALLARIDRDTPLVIAGGDGWLGQREALAALAQKLGLSERVRFVGFVEDALLPALLNLAAALVYPSRYEGFGLPVLEALACGLPTITARNTSLPEAGGDAARYIAQADDAEALADAMRVVLNDEAERTRLRAAGLAHAARFTWPATARQVLGLYRQVLGSAR